jgi:hypothetical protein
MSKVKVDETKEGFFASIEGEPMLPFAGQGCTKEEAVEMLASELGDVIRARQPIMDKLKKDNERLRRS